MFSIALLLGPIACRRDGSDRLDTARASLNDAFSRHDVTALRNALAELRAVKAETPEELSELAALMMRAGETAHALWLLEAGIARHPDRDDLRILLAKAALVVDDPVRVLATLERIAADSEQHLASLILRARAQLELGDLDAALALFVEAERRYPNSPHASQARVFTLLQEGRVEDARLAIEEARQGAQSPERGRDLDLLVAQIEFARGDQAAGLERLRALVEAAPDDLQIRQTLTRGLQVAGKLEEALEVARAGLARNPEHPAPQAMVARAYSLLGQWDEAEQSLRALAERTDSPSAHLLLARFLLFNGPSEAGAASLHRAAERYPDAPMLRMHEAEAWLDLEDLERARTALEAFRQRAAEDPHVRYLEARLSLGVGDAARAASELSQVVSSLDRAYTQYWLARALEVTGDDAGARRRYWLAMSRDRSHPAPAVALMRLAERRGNWLNAAEYAAQLVARSPAEPEGYANLATFLARTGGGARAEAAARVFIERFPDREEAAALLAMSLRVQGKPEEASEILVAAESRHGPSPEFSHERALIFGAQGNTEAGIRAARKAIAERPDEPRYHASLAALAFAAGDVTTGDTAVDSALKVGPTHLEPLKLRATYRAATGDLSGAQADLERYLDARPYDAAVHFIRGVVCEKEGRVGDAAAAYRRAIELDEGAFAPYNNLAMLLVEMDQVDEAVRMASKAYARASANPQVVGTLGWVYLHSGLAARSVILLERAHELNPGSADTRLHLALAYREVGRDADARDILTALVAMLDVGSELGSQASAVLRSLEN